MKKHTLIICKRIACFNPQAENDPETASLLIRVFHAALEPFFSAAKNSLPGLDFGVHRHVHN